MKTENPFLIRSEFIPQKHFTRKDETSLILHLLSEGNNIFILAADGAGKTDLIENIFYQLKKQKIKTIYFNLRNNSNLKDLLLQFFERKREEDYSKSDSPLSEQSANLKEHLSGKKKGIVVAIDNIQLADKDLLSFLQNKFIDQPPINNKIRLVLSGSEKLNISKNIQEIKLNLIPEIELQKYIVKTFNKEKIKIDKKLAIKIISWSESNFYTIKLVCSKLWSLNKKKVKENNLDFVILNLLNEYENIFLQIKKLLSDYQWKLLKAIAIDKDSIQITSANFIKEYELNAPSSVKTAVTALQDKGLIFKSGKTYKLTNVLLSRWLKIN